MEYRTELKKVILDDESLRYCEIYKITNQINHKIYIGKAVSHILNHKKFRPYGMEGRFRCHISEAFSTKKNQCYYLNNAIRKYGSSNFTLQLVKYCNIDDSDAVETEEILKYNSLFPNGYNLNTGGRASKHTTESKKRVSMGVMNYFKDKRFQKFAGITIDETDDLEKYIRPLNRNNVQYGWYVYIKRKKTDFGGSHIPLEESRQLAEDFIKILKQNQRRDQIAGNPLEPSLPLTCGNACEDLG